MKDGAPQEISLAEVMTADRVARLRTAIRESRWNEVTDSDLVVAGEFYGIPLETNGDLEKFLIKPTIAYAITERMKRDSAFT